MIEMYVDSGGHVGEVRIGRAVGLELDERAVAAIRQYVFDTDEVSGRRRSKRSLP
jgi:hypothetical protein